MSENGIVYALLEALENVEGPKREPIVVGRLLAHCQQVCPEWIRGCKRYGLGEWIGVMITPGRKCSRRRLRAP